MVSTLVEGAQRSRFKRDSSNVDLALTRFAIAYTQAKRSTFKPLILLGNLVAGTGFEPVTFRL